MKNVSIAVEMLGLVVLWGFAVARDFDGFILLVAVVVTVRFVVFDRHGYRLVTRGRSWEPSKDPDDYR